MKAGKADKEIQNDVMAELTWEPALSPTEIGVGVKDGIVTLSGTVKTYAEKMAAIEAAQRIKGVKAVAIDIEVRLTRDGKITDTSIAANIAQTLKWHSSIPEGSIHVLVDNGHVTLSGEVDWIFQKRSAESAISQLGGIRDIKNDITVKPLVSTDNVESKIKRALQRNAELEANDITVERSGRKVILKGFARSWSERHEIERAAASAPGVAEVEDRLTIVH